VGPEAGLDRFDDLSLELLRARRSAKWTTHPADVLPAFVAEMDFALAPPIRALLAELIERSDTGYPSPGSLGEAFAGFAGARFGWEVDPGRVRAAPDVMTAVTELLRALTAPGDEVVVNTPIYPPFLSVTAEIGRRVVEAPLSRSEHGFELDLDALEAAFAGGARAYLLCHPHNPTGRSFRRDELELVSSLAARHGVAVISDEIHAPLTLPGARHVPYLTLGEEAATHAVAVAGASKGWNLAGLKCALIVSGSAEMDARLDASLSSHLRYHVGHLGVVASIAAFEQGGPWLEAVVSHLDHNRRSLDSLLRSRLPEVVYVQPEAGYLAWLDCRRLELGEDPAAAFLEHGRVALSPGPSFGTQGRGFARLNFATSSALLAEAVGRMAAGARHGAEAQGA
jgi:cysteine-S-conjugate beta-lyase